MIYKKEDVLNFLPHREPFLFVDSVSKVELGSDATQKESMTTKDLVGSTVVAHFFTREDHPIFAGHFPGKPILPGVVQIEMMAQASSFALSKIHKDSTELEMDVALLSVSDAKFRKPVLPGYELEIRTTCTKVRGGFMNHDCEIYYNGELMSQASVFATITFKEKKA
tara:strand:+ start:6895 stop:7395 length:501 start_codon:yes stop_codon:yes gene_type:complete